MYPLMSAFTLLFGEQRTCQRVKEGLSPHLHVVFQLRRQAEHQEVVGIRGAEVLGAHAVLGALQGPRHQLVPPGCPGATPGAAAGPGPRVRHDRVTSLSQGWYDQREDALINGANVPRWLHVHVPN